MMDPLRAVQPLPSSSHESGAPSSAAKDVDGNGSAAATSDMQRSESSSSSVTVHPLNNNDVKGAGTSSSTSSSPTFLSNSSSAHKTNSTIASSLQTADSHYSFQQGRNGSKTIRAPDGSATADKSMEADAPGSSNSAAPFYDQQATHPPPESSRWDQHRYHEMDDDVYSVHDEEAPIQYPPFSDEEREARRIEQKLEKWAAEEKQRRKAKRSSRTASVLVTPSASNRLSKRLSVLGSLASGKSGQPTLPETQPAAFDSTQGNTADRGGSSVYGKQGAAITSSDGLVDHGRGYSNGSSRWAREGSSSGLDNVPEGQVEDNESIGSSGTYTSSSKAKGKSRDMSDPFKDPAPYAKPTARTPIVTPGRAPTIRHRAQERTRRPGEQQNNNAINGSDTMPAIVATDADEEKEAQAALERFQSLEDNPFQSASEREAASAAAASKAGYPARPVMKSYNSTYTIGSTIDGDLNDGNVLPKRKSTNSRFNEIGLDDGQDASGWPTDPHDDESRRSAGQETPRAAGPRMTPARYTDADTAHNGGHQDVDRETPYTRTPWWTEWLCGCAPTDADLEQSGRTFPE